MKLRLLVLASIVTINVFAQSYYGGLGGTVLDQNGEMCIRDSLPIVRYVPPEEFDEFKRLGYEIGFAHVESGPLVRSSYHAAESVAAQCT